MGAVAISAPLVRTLDSLGLVFATTVTPSISRSTCRCNASFPSSTTTKLLAPGRPLTHRCDSCVQLVPTIKVYAQMTTDTSFNSFPTLILECFKAFP